MKTLKVLSILSFLALGACAGQQIKKEKLEKVQRVAVIGFDALQQKSVSGSDLLGLALGGKGAGSATIKLAAISSHVDPMIVDLEQKLRREKSWKVVSIADLKKSPAYMSLLKQKTEGFQNRPAVPDRYDPFRAAEVLDFWAIMTTPNEQLQKVAAELKVDALVIATSKVHLNNSGLFSSLMGNGEYKPKSELTMIIIDVASGEKIFTKTVEGPAVEQGEKNVLGMADDAKLNRLAQVATERSVDLMLKEVPSRH